MSNYRNVGFRKVSDVYVGVLLLQRSTLHFDRA